MQWVPNVHPLQTGPMMSTVVPPIAEGVRVYTLHTQVYKWVY